MAERWLTFTEVEALLGLASEEVRELMESRVLQGRIIDGVVKFREADVRRLSKQNPAKAETHFRFLVDEEDEKRIEGKAYDGEAFQPPKPVEKIGEEEELVEPIDLSDEQVRNSQILGRTDIVQFGREVAQRSMAQEFTSKELGDEEIFDPSQVELPEVPYGPLAERITQARREEPAEPQPVAPQEVTHAAPEEIARVAPVESAAKPSEPEPVVPQAFTLAVPEEPAVPAPAETHVTFVTDEGETVKPMSSEPVAEQAFTEISFVAEEAKPMACPITEEAKAEAEKPGEMTEVLPLRQVTTPMEFVEAPPAAQEPAPPAPEVVAPQEVTPEPSKETYEVETPEPVAPVTKWMDFAVDEETAEVTPAESSQVQSAAELPPEIVLPAPAQGPIAEVAPAESSQPQAAPELPSEIVPPAPMESPVLDLPAPAEEFGVAVPAAHAAVPVESEQPELVSAGAENASPTPKNVDAAPPSRALATPEYGLAEGKRTHGAAPERAVPQAPDIVSEIEAELAAESAKESLPSTSRGDTMSARQANEIREPVPKSSGPAEVPQEEAKPVTDETKKPKPADKKKPEDIEVFDLEQPGAKPEEVFDILEEEPAEAAPASAADAKEKTLEDEMAELFGDEQKPAAPDEAFKTPEVPKVEEDFDLSVFQKDKQEAVAAEPAPIAEETLFDVDQQAAEPEHETSVHDLQGVSRIRAITEERTPTSVYLFTAAIILAFGVVAFAGMLVALVFLRR